MQRALVETLPHGRNLDSSCLPDRLRERLIRFQKCVCDFLNRQRDRISQKKMGLLIMNSSHGAQGRTGWRPKRAQVSRYWRTGFGTQSRGRGDSRTSLANFAKFLQNFANFWRARSRLYQNEILQESMRSTAFFKLYKICILLHRCNLKISACGF